MRILLTNDDGIRAPGLKALEHVARELSKDVWVVAPETEQSAASHSLTLHRPLRLRRIAARRWAVNGTPTDCVYLAIHKVLQGKRPDLVLSGVNRGSNIGEDVTYSGTIAAAMEATLLRVPSIALSQHYDYGEPIPWQTSKVWGVKAVRALMKQGWPRNVLINVNFPGRPVSKVKGILAGKQGEHEVFDAFEERIDPRGRTYYWVGQDHVEDVQGARGTDLHVVNKGYVSVTPLHLNLTHQPTLTQLRKVFS
ncbi:MAG: 5'/3'-nucleotidase SurE [Rhodospirillaceae bacterium]|nr:5'/3'-nucleotidase SurE [Rhodospirillaceae bacterium]|tara:strand:+ start:2376 stop:3131 length:756 start_codon:yes stop_codon:yes gene_type:complete